MTWLAWRQFRAQAAVAVIATVAATIVLVVTRDHVAHHPGDLSNGYQSLRLLGTGLIGVPAFIGAFWGAPLIARELEAGTHRLVWTQSVTRARWLTAKLGVAGGVAVIGTAVFSAVFTWWSLPLDRLGNRIGTANFGQRGIAPIAYAVFALALGALLGAVTRRTLPAMVGTLAGFFVVRFVFQWVVRPHLLATVVVSRPSWTFGPQPGSSPASGAWVVSSKTVDAAGHTIGNRAIDRALVDVCGLTRDATQGQRIACVKRLGIQDVVEIHPANHFWTLQAAEVAVFVGLALALAAACFWWVRHRA
jgi:hypothetical protein